MPHEIPDGGRSASASTSSLPPGEERNHLLVFDFPPGQCVRLGFSDGSYAFFRYAFYLRDEREVAVFTEHCGYHFFPAGLLEVEVLKTVWQPDDQEDEEA